MSVFALQARVTVTSDEEKPPRMGTVVGVGHVLGIESMLPVYIVELDEGFYSADGDTYIKKVVAHPDNMRDAR